MRCLDCELNICPECISTDQHTGHKIKSLKFLLNEAQLKMSNTKLELNKYNAKILKCQENMTKLK